MFLYSSFNKGFLPLNVVVPPNGKKSMFWYDPDRIGRFLLPSSSLAALGGPVGCPEDIGGLRSYSMNFWASSMVDSFSVNDSGSLWRLPVRRSSQQILVAERWSGTGSAAAGWTATATVGGTNNTPGERFGGGGGVPVASSGHFGQANCELPFQRHRTTRGRGRGTQPVGRVNIGYADGHVSLKADTELVDSSTGLSTLDSWWTPLDEAKNK